MPAASSGTSRPSSAAGTVSLRKGDARRAESARISHYRSGAPAARRDDHARTPGAERRVRRRPRALRRRAGWRGQHSTLFRPIPRQKL